jgi:hypothetical protein
MADEQTTRRVVIWIIVAIIVILIIVFIFVFLTGQHHTVQVLTSSVTNCPSLLPPNNVAVTQTDNQTIVVSWQTVTGAPRYKVFVGTTSGFSEASALTTQISDTNQAIISSLITGYTYYVFVESLNDCNVTSPKSSEASHFLTFPAQFKIVNRSSPFYVMTNDATNVDLEPDCQNSASNACLYTYNSNNSFIMSVNDPTMCVVSFPNFPNPNRLELKTCASIEASTDPSIGMWQYNEVQGALCNYPDTDNDPTVATTSCTVLNGAFAAGTEIELEGYSNSPQDIWDILPVP